jgi:hypothetical protein
VDKGNNKFPTHGVYLYMYYITQCNEDEFNNKVSKAPTPRQLPHTHTPKQRLKHIKSLFYSRIHAKQLSQRFIKFIFRTD